MFELTESPIYTDSAAVYPYNPGMESGLRFTSRYGDEVTLSVRRGDRLLVPRALAPSYGKDMMIRRPIPAISCKMPPRSAEQAKCIADSLSLLSGGVSHILEAPTGFGKTYLGGAIAAGLGQTTIIIVTKQDLMKQWKDTLIDLIGVAESDIGIAQAAELDYKGKRFVLAMVQSVIRPDKYDLQFYESFGFVIFDETHRMAADCFSRACFMFPGAYRLGLSATPKRNDGKTPVLSAHIGSVMVRGKTIPMAPKVLVKKTGWKIPAYVRYEPGRMQGVYAAMAHSATRTTEIVKFLQDSYAAGRTTVVMSDTLDYLNKVQLACGAVGIPGEDMGRYIGEFAKNPALLKVNAHKKIVFATYGMCSEGTDFDHWDTLLMITPRANVKQMIGRILRSRPGKKTPVVLDLLDHGTLFSRFFNKRLTSYHEVGARVVTL